MALYEAIIIKITLYKYYNKAILQYY